MLTVVSALASFFVLLLSVPAFAQGLIVLYPSHRGVADSPYGFSCKVGTEKAAHINFKTDKLNCKNDDAKSMTLMGYFKKGTKILLFDDPGGKRSDDWFEVEFLQDMVNVRYVIPTFEESFRDHYLNAVFHKRNGLDGKVSRMEIILPSQ